MAVLEASHNLDPAPNSSEAVPVDIQDEPKERDSVEKYCPICDKTFASHFCLKRHIRRRHKEHANEYIM